MVGVKCCVCHVFIQVFRWWILSNRPWLCGLWTSGSWPGFGSRVPLHIQGESCSFFYPTFQAILYDGLTSDCLFVCLHLLGGICASRDKKIRHLCTTGRMVYHLWNCTPWCTMHVCVFKWCTNGLLIVGALATTWALGSQGQIGPWCSEVSRALRWFTISKGGKLGNTKQHWQNRQHLQQGHVTVLGWICP